MYFEIEQPPLSASTTLIPPVLQNGVPVLAGEWTAWLPEEFAAESAEQESRRQNSVGNSVCLVRWRARAIHFHSTRFGQPIGRN